MRIVLKKQYNSSEDYHKLNIEIDFDNDRERREVENLAGMDIYDIGLMLRNNFETQDKLYEIINEEYIDGLYDPKANYFNEGNRGFRRFIREMKERELQQLGDIYANIIISKVEYIREMHAHQMSHRVYITLNKEEEEEKDLEKIKIKEPAIIIANDKAYSFKLKEIKDMEGYDSIKKNIYETIYEDLNAQMKVIRNNYDRRIDRLKELFEREKNELFADILKNSREIFTNWSFVEDNGELYLKYNDRITTTTVMHNGRSFAYPADSNAREMYVTGLRIRVTPTISESDVKITRGHNIHFNGTSGCIGDFHGKPLFDVLKELPRSLAIANMDSPLNSGVARQLNEEFLREAEAGVQEERRPETEWVV